ncbi:hypothetical protein BH10ACI4_BH10ACI4_12090 [soil metagenome]
MSIGTSSRAKGFCSVKLGRKVEEATRQQGDLFLRENSSNGGKAIRTFWRNTKFGQNRCQGLKSAQINRYLGVSYGGDRTVNTPLDIRLSFAFTVLLAFQTVMK